MKSNKLADRPQDNKAKLLISNKSMLALNKALLSNSCFTLRKLKQDLNIIASTRTIRRAIHQMDWHHAHSHPLTKYCQMIRPVNRLKRFIYACLSKRFEEDYDDAIFVDECTVELKIFIPTNWRKDYQPLLNF